MFILFDYLIGYALFYAYGLALSSPFFMSLGELLNLTGAGRKCDSTYNISQQQTACINFQIPAW